MAEVEHEAVKRWDRVCSLELVERHRVADDRSRDARVGDRTRRL
jgi:hypothetical protein